MSGYSVQLRYIRVRRVWVAGIPKYLTRYVFVQNFQ